MHSLGQLSPTAAGAQRAAGIVRALAPPSIGAEPTALDRVKPKQESVGFVRGLAPVGAGIVGALAWKRHRVLGFFGGHALGESAFSFMEGDTARGLTKLGIEAAAIGGSLKFKRHPVLGYFGGLLAGLGISYLIPGSTTKTEWEKLKARTAK